MSPFGPNSRSNKWRYCIRLASETSCQEVEMIADWHRLCGVAVEYAFPLRVPVLVALLTAFLPWIAFKTAARSLLRGLFDLTPASLFAVALAAMAASGSACATAHLVLQNGAGRFGI